MKCGAALCFVVCVLQLTGSVRTKPSVRISAVDSKGNRIESFEAMLAVGSTRQTQWYDSKNGSVLFRSYDLKSRMGGEDEYIGATEVFVRSPGYATDSRKFFLGDAEASLELVLSEGRLLTVTFRDEATRKIPKDLHPFFLPTDYRDAGLYRWQQPEGSQFRHPDDENWYLLEFVKPGEYTVRITDRTPDLYLHIDDYDFLRCYENGPYRLAEHAKGELEVVLPTPASVRARFRVPEETPVKDLPMNSLTYSVSRPKDRGGSTSFPIHRESFPELDSELSIDNLSPGNLYVKVRTTSKKQVRYGETDPGVFRDRELLDLQSGETHSLDFKYRRFSREPFKGKNNVLLRVLDRSGAPANGKEFRVEYADRNFGRFIVTKGTIESGEIELSDVVATVEDEEYPARYALYVNERTIGRFAVEVSDRLRVESFVLAPDVGDAAVELKATSLEGGVPVKVDFMGHVTLLEFWATWCGPCQVPMRDLDQIASENAAKWGDRVQLIALSLDDQAEKVQRHIESRNWVNVDILVDVSAQGGGADSRNGFSSSTAKAYLVSGVPTAILIDDRGTIVFRGHPDSLDLVTRVEELLQTN